MSNAITNKIKTYSILYSVEEIDGEVPATPQLQPMRISKDGNGIKGEKEEISSDILLPGTRIPSTPEVGSASNSGDINTEWNADEQDPWFAAVFCGEWVTDSQNPNKKTLKLGDTTKSFSFFEKFPQKPAAWQHYKKEFCNQLSMQFATGSFVKLTWNWMGSNAPDMVADFPIEDAEPTFLEALKTKSFLTKGNMWLKLGDTVETLESFRQSPSLSITINNNLEKTSALGEDESIENSLGDFVVSGQLDAYNVDDKGIALHNDANQGKDKVLQVRVSRKVGTVTTSYTLTLNVHLGAPSKSKNGNKYQFSVPFQVNKVDDLSLVKEVVDETPSPTPVVDAETPTFGTNLENVTYTTVDTATALDGMASVTDGGVITYQWYKDDVAIDGETSATYTPDISETGEHVYKVVATNTNESATGSTTATAENSCTVTVTE